MVVISHNSRNEHPLRSSFTPDSMKNHITPITEQVAKEADFEFQRRTSDN